MKKALTLIAILLFNSYLFSGNLPFELCSKKPSFQPFYTGYANCKEKIFIELDYQESVAIKSKDLKVLKSSDIIGIELVFSNFPEGGIYEELNKSRLRSLAKILPDIEKMNYINWKFIATGRNLTENAAKSMFHGFVVHCRPKATMAGMHEGIKRLNSINFDTISNESICYKNNVVTKVFKRNKFLNPIFACDVTGSMTPYSEQVMIWLSLQKTFHPNAQFLFFNDGDSKRDADKIIGKTGGLYLTGKAKDFDAVLKTLTKAMSKGCGGDGPENNIEALIKLQKDFPKAKEFVMVVDNYAPIKDISLLKEIKIPVRIILCGSKGGFVNPDYLNLAKYSGGSLHTMEKDLVDLKKKTVGSILKVNGKNYKLTTTGFIKI